MNARVDLPGVVLFAVLVAAVAWLVAVEPPEAGAAHRPVTAFRVTDEAPVSFAIPAGSTRVKIVSIAETLQPADPVVDQDYTVWVAWRDAAGAVVGERVLSLRARPSEPPSNRPGGAAVLTPRSTVLFVPEAEPPVVALEVRVPPGGTPVRVRVFRDRPAPLDAPEFDLLTVDERDAAVLPRQIGLGSWDEVTVDEALALAALRWQSVEPIAEELPEGARTITRLADPPLTSLGRRAAGTPLPGGRALAWTLAGPIDALLVADGDLAAATVRVVMEDQGEVPVEVAEAAPPSWRADARAARVRVAAAGRDATLHLLAGPDAPLDGVLLLIDPDRAAGLPEDAEVAPVTTFLPPGTPDARETSVLPSFLRLERSAARVGREVVVPVPPVATDVALRLELRPVGTDGPVPLVVSVQGSNPPRAWPLALHAPPSAYERAAPMQERLDHGRWIGEAVERFLRIRPGDERVTIAVDAGADPRVTVLVSASMPGPEAGSRLVVDEAGVTVLRYARDVRAPWTQLPTVPAPDWRLAAMRRRELLPLDESEVVRRARRWTAVEPVGRGGGRAGETWLVPVGPDDPRAGLAYCELPPDGRPVRFRLGARALEELGGVLSAVIWAPGAEARPRLGDPWSVTLDGQPWASGTLATAVDRHAARARPVAEAAFVGPAGARAWLRTLDRDGMPCDALRRARRLVELAPGETLRWVLDVPRDDRLFVITGVGDVPVNLAVDIVPAVEVDGPVEDWTLRHRVLSLAPLPDAEAVALDTPWRRSTALDTAGLRLRSDLVGRVEIRATSLGETPVRLVALYEDDGVGREMVDARRVRR